MFQYTKDEFESLAGDALAMARGLGASDCAVDLTESYGLTVNVRMRKLETVEQTRDKSLGVTVYLESAKDMRAPAISPLRRSSRPSVPPTTLPGTPVMMRPRACPKPTRSPRRSTSGTSISTTRGT